MRHDFCLSVIIGLFHNSLESSLSMSSLSVLLQIMGVWMAIVSKLFVWSCFFICFSNGAFIWCVYHGGSFIFLVVVRCGTGVFVWMGGIYVGKV